LLVCYSATNITFGRRNALIYTARSSIRAGCCYTMLL
jgi:hypothetical protein